MKSYEEEINYRRSAKNDLRRYAEASNETRHCLKKIEALTSEFGPYGVGGSEGGIGPRPSPNYAENAMCQLADLTKYYEEKVAKNAAICRLLEERVSRWTSGIASQVLRRRFFFRESLGDVAKAESYSYSSIKRIYSEALTQYGESLLRESPKRP